MKGGSVCSNSTIVADNDRTQFQAYTYSATSIMGMDCGFFIQINRLPDIERNPGEGNIVQMLLQSHLTRNDVFVNITGSGATAKATNFNLQDMSIGGSAAEEVKDYRDREGKKLDEVLQDKIRDGTFEGGPIEVCDEVLGKNNYQIIIFDSDAREGYVKRPQKYDKDNKEDNSTSESIQQKQTEAQSPTDESESTTWITSSDEEFIIQQKIKTDNINGVEVLKLVSVSDINGKLPEEEGNEILNKDNISKVLCNKIAEKLNNNKDTKKTFQMSDSEVIALQNDFKTKKEREQASYENLNTVKRKLLEAIEKLNNLKIKGIENLGDVITSINNYISLKDPIKKHDIPQTFSSHPLQSAILSKYESPDGLDIQKLYNFCKAITNNINGILGNLTNVSEITAEDGDIEIHMKDNKTIIEKEKFMVSISKYLFSKKKIPLLKEDVGYKSTMESTKQMARSAMSGLRRGFSMSSMFNNGLNKAKKMAQSTGFSRKKTPDASAAQSNLNNPITTGGKRKTRKIKARKTRRKVQKKRRQSKKH